MHTNTHTHTPNQIGHNLPLPLRGKKKIRNKSESNTILSVQYTSAQLKKLNALNLQVVIKLI